MKLKFYNAAELDAKMKATVHSSGKLGFSIEANRILNLKDIKSVEIGTNEEDTMDFNLYMILHYEVKPGAFKLIKVGNYFNLNTKGLFDSLKVDYKNLTVIYDIVKTVYQGQEILQLIRRDIKKKNKAADKK
ncbi:hypothetical protein PQG46_02700 [Aquirufa nivalisilvae]